MDYRSRLASALALSCSIALIACSGDSAAPDSGGLTIDAQGLDASTVDASPADGGGTIACEGTAAPCGTLGSEAECGTVMGCGWTQCAGFAVECEDHRTSTLCEGSSGCAWSGVTCNGTAAECSSHLAADGCRMQPGCTWSTVAQCRGLPIPCDTFARESCTSQPGCRERVAPFDAGPRDGGPPPMCMADGGTTPGCIVPTPPSPIVGCNPELGIECDGDWRGTNARTGAEYCTPACTADQCCSPRDGRFECVARGEDGTCPAADIYIDASHIEGRYTIDTETFGVDSCEIEEACVGGTGERRLLRFDTWTPNVGGADLFLGQVPMDGTSTPTFSWSSCDTHRHHHFNSYATYELISNDLCCVAATGHKQAFCLIDLARHDPEVGGDRAAYDCGYQGIQRGWQDVYGSGLDCQFVDITDVAPGDYVLRIRVNTEHILGESNYDNNQIDVPVRIP